MRIFKMYASGMNPRKISEILNEENIPCSGQYAFEKFGHKGKPCDRRLWGQITIASMLNNMVYIGHMPQLMFTSVSYKNHKRCKKDQSEWVVVYNTHPPIISQELWDKVREIEKSVA